MSLSIGMLLPRIWKTTIHVPITTNQMFMHGHLWYHTVRWLSHLRTREDTFIIEKSSNFKGYLHPSSADTHDRHAVDKPQKAHEHIPIRTPRHFILPSAPRQLPRHFYPEIFKSRQICHDVGICNSRWFLCPQIVFDNLGLAATEGAPIPCSTSIAIQFACS